MLFISLFWMFKDQYIISLHMLVYFILFNTRLFRVRYTFVVEVALIFHQDPSDFAHHCSGDFDLLFYRRNGTSTTRSPWALMLCSYWLVIKCLVIMHLWCKQEAPTSNHYWLKAKCLQCNLLQENWTLIHES